MKKLLVFGLIIYSLFQVWDRLGLGKSETPLYAESYVAVYGRNACGFTTAMLKNLKASNVHYFYFDIDDQAVLRTLQSRMEASGISTQYYKLPVVDVNGAISVRPEFGDVLSRYKVKL